MAPKMNIFSSLPAEKVRSAQDYALVLSDIWGPWNEDRTGLYSTGMHLWPCIIITMYQCRSIVKGKMVSVLATFETRSVFWWQTRETLILLYGTHHLLSFDLLLCHIKGNAGASLTRVTSGLPVPLILANLDLEQKDYRTSIPMRFIHICMHIISLMFQFF